MVNEIKRSRRSRCDLNDFTIVNGYLRKEMLAKKFNSSSSFFKDHVKWQCKHDYFHFKLLAFIYDPNYHVQSCDINRGDKMHQSMASSSTEL